MVIKGILKTKLKRVRHMGFGKNLKKGFAKVAGGLAEDLTGSEAVGKGVKKGIKKGSAKKGFKKMYEEGKEEAVDLGKDTLIGD